MNITYKDLTGQFNNSWTILGFSHQREDSKNAYWFARCKCGNESVINGSAFVLGKTKQCKSCSARINGRKGIYAKSKGDLYMIRVGDYVKIGVSLDVKRRIKDIESCSPFTAELIYHGEGEGFEEEEWHNIFKHRQHKGEWFYMPLRPCEI
jgi:hypothetical protein